MSVKSLCDIGGDGMVCEMLPPATNKTISDKSNQNKQSEDIATCTCLDVQ